MLGCTPLLAVNTEDMRFQHYCRLLSIISHSATTANRSSRSRNCVHGRSRSNTVHRMLYLVHQPHTHACDRSWLIMAFNRAWWRQWEHYFAVCGISYTSCQHIFYRQKFARELCTGKVTARHQQWRVPLWALALTYTWRSARMYAVTSHIAASLPLKTSEADEATSCLSALSIIKVSDGVAYTRTVLTAARWTKWSVQSRGFAVGSRYTWRKCGRQSAYAAVAQLRWLLAWPCSYPLQRAM